jgi:hypothetical protein
MDRRHFLAGLGAATLPMAGHAQSGRTVRVIVPFAPGGPTDLTTRIITEKAAQTLGTPMLVDNRPVSGRGRRDRVGRRELAPDSEPAAHQRVARAGPHRTAPLAPDRSLKRGKRWSVTTGPQPV